MPKEKGTSESYNKSKALTERKVVASFNKSILDDPRNSWKNDLRKKHLEETKNIYEANRKLIASLS